MQKIQYRLQIGGKEMPQDYGTNKDRAMTAADAVADSGTFVRVISIDESGKKKTVEFLSPPSEKIEENDKNREMGIVSEWNAEEEERQTIREFTPRERFTPRDEEVYQEHGGLNCF